jgi:hypothetical protein
VSRRLSLNKNLCGKLWALHHKKAVQEWLITDISLVLTVPAASRLSGTTNGVCDRLNLELSIRGKNPPKPQNARVYDTLTVRGPTYSRFSAL